MTAPRPSRRLRAQPLPAQPLPAQPPPPSGDPGDGPLADSDTRDAVTTAMSTEHAAIWSYGLASAYLPATAGLDTAIAAHRARRDALAALLETNGVVAPPAAAAYATPAPVTDAASAAALLAVAEDDTAAVWRAVVERTDDPDLRRVGTDAVIGAATVGARWRRLAGRTPLVPVFPGG